MLRVALGYGYFFKEFTMTNIYSQFCKIAKLILLPTTFVLVGSFNNPAQAQLVSESGNLRIEILRSYQEACATEKPSDSYSVENGVSGLLYPNQCGGYGTDVVEYRFVDTSGTERCTGVVGSGGGGGRGIPIEMYWKIEDAVPGYRCSTIGETYLIKMYSE